MSPKLALRENHYLRSKAEMKCSFSLMLARQQDGRESQVSVKVQVFAYFSQQHPLDFWDCRVWTNFSLSELEPFSRLSKEYTVIN